MTTTYTYEDFDKKLLAMLGKGPRDLIEFAVLSCGWTLSINQNNTATIIAPHDPRVVQRFSNRSKASVGNERAMLRRIIRHGDPVRMVMTRTAAKYPDLITFDPKDIQVEHPVTPEIKPVAKKASLTAAVTEAQEEAMAHPRVLFSETRRAVEDVVRGAKPKPPVTVEVDRHVVSQQVWMAHQGTSAKSGGKSYPSRSTDVRHWSDGTTDYVCRYPGCGWWSETPKATTQHFAAKHVRHGDVAKQESETVKASLVEDPTYVEHGSVRGPRGYSPRGDRVEAVAEVLDEYASVGSLEQARQALIWLHEQQVANGESAALEPETPEQTLEKIRRMLDRGEYAAQREAMSHKDEELSKMAAMAAERLARIAGLETEVDTLRSSLTALHDMLGDLMSQGVAVMTETETGG